MHNGNEFRKLKRNLSLYTILKLLNNFFLLFIFAVVIKIILTNQKPVKIVDSPKKFELSIHKIAIT